MTKKHLGIVSATSIVFASMVGTGVFTSLGFQAIGIHSGFALLSLWVIGGITAFTGALSYGELGASFPRSGGEYNFLSEIYHPAAGFLAGFVSATVGFAAPIAASSIALGTYLSRIFPQLSPTYVACSVVVLLTLVHLTHLKMAKGVQNVFTLLNLCVILTLVVFGFLAPRTGDASFAFSEDAASDIFSSSFGYSLFFVYFAYSGWNASTYIAGEIKNPQRNLPLSLALGTFIVSSIYILLNYVFIYTVPLAEMQTAQGSPVIEIGAVSATKIFGEIGGDIIGITISLLLFASVNSMIMTGPRVTKTMGEDIRLFRLFALENKRGIPLRAIVFQSAISLFFILTSTFEAVITYIGFTLNLFTYFAVIGLFVLRFKYPDLARPYKTWGYPVTPIIFLCMGTWLLIYGLLYRPFESLAGVITLTLGLAVYFIDKKLSSAPIA